MTVSFIICSVLFCVHFLSLYYLLEPYTDNSNNASISYVALYILVLYIFANLTRFDQISLHLVLLISAIVLPIYMIIMLKLVKKLSPKTFRYK
jgi:ABC-type transport system involved in cytochrome bd biosynthesis fused ATPase/permease subunit